MTFGYNPDPQQIPLAVPHNGIGITVLFGASATNNTTWSGATGDFNTQGSGITVSLAHTFASGSDTISASGWNYGGAALAGAAWGPASEPVITNISSGSPGFSTSTITWITDEAANSEVVYGTTTSYGSASSSASLVTGHSISLTGLATSTTYHYAVVSKDGSGRTSTSTDQTFTTAADAAPVISNISSGSPGASTSTITWTTDENANSEVVYGLTTSYGSASSSASLVISHSISLTGLSAGTTYHFAVVSADSLGTTATSTDQTFTTASGGGGVTFTPTDNPANQSIGNASSTALFPGVNIGTPSSDRIVVVAVSLVANYAAQNVTIGGISATEATGTIESNSTSQSIWYASVPTGTSADITVNVSNGCCELNAIGIAVGTLTGATATPTSLDTVTSAYNPDPQTIPITVPSNGVGIVMLGGRADSTPTTWSNATGDYTTGTAGTSITVSLAHTYNAGSDTPSATGWNYGGAGLAGAAWGP